MPEMRHSTCCTFRPVLNKLTWYSNYFCSKQFKETLYKTTVKLFADYEIRRRELAERDAVLRKREREEEIVQEEKVKKQKEWEKEWEVHVGLVT